MPWQEMGTVPLENSLVGHLSITTHCDTRTGGRQLYSAGSLRAAIPLSARYRLRRRGHGAVGELGRSHSQRGQPTRTALG